MPKEEWGTKRVCPTTGKRFYDLNATPIISPYTGDAVEVESGKTRTMVADKADKAGKTDDTTTDNNVIDEGDEVLEEDNEVDLGDDVLEDDEDDDVSLDDIADVAANDDE